MSPVSYPFFYIVPQGLSIDQVERWAAMMTNWGVSAYFAGSRALFRTLDDVEGAVAMLAEILAVPATQIG